MSVDLVGSTAFKNKTETVGEGAYRNGPPWADVFRNFYNGFPTMFERMLEHRSLPEAIRPRLVKTIGDELLLQTEIRRSQDAKDVVSFFSSALATYTETNLSDKPLLLKGTAWVAGFPINNFRVTFAEEGGRIGGEDFIGPSIDTGFRIAKTASPSKLAVSVDLALLLLAGRDKLDLYYDGNESLKGVLGGKPYPMIWYRVYGPERALFNAELALKNVQADKEKLEKYCDEFIKSCRDTWLIRPYLPDDSDFREKPPWHEEVIKTWDQVASPDNENELIDPTPVPPQ